MYKAMDSGSGTATKRGRKKSHLCLEPSIMGHVFNYSSFKLETVRLLQVEANVDYIAIVLSQKDKISK